MCAQAILALATLLIAQAASAETKRPRLTIDIHARRADIRETLLKYTPIGSSFEYVMDLIPKQLALPAAVSAMAARPAKDISRPRVAKTIDVYLGDYYKNVGAV